MPITSYALRGKLATAQDYVADAIAMLEESEVIAAITNLRGAIRVCHSIIADLGQASLICARCGQVRPCQNERIHNGEPL